MTYTYTPAFRNSGGDIITGFARNYLTPGEAQASVDMLNQDIPADSSNPVFVAVHDGLQYSEYNGEYWSTHKDLTVAA
jgi:hypothetical protein